MKWEVIGIQPKLKQIVYKNTYMVVDPKTGEGVSCNYKGIAKGEGVQLGVWSIEQNKTIQVWNVYKAVLSPDDCMSEEQAEKALTGAKTYFAKKGIDISSPPTGFAPDSKDQFHLVDTNGKKYQFNIWKLKDLDIPDEKEPKGYLVKRWIAKESHDYWSKENLYSVEKQGSRLKEKQIHVNFPFGYVVDKQVVFLERTEIQYQTHTAIHYTFTAALELELQYE